MTKKIGIEEVIKNLEYGNVVKYTTKIGTDVYFIIEEVKDGRVRGNMAGPIGVNSISIEELLKQENLELIYKAKK